MIDGEFSVAVWGYLTKLKAQVISSTPIDTTTIEIRDKDITFEVQGRRVQLQVIDRGDF